MVRPSLSPLLLPLLVFALVGAGSCNFTVRALPLGSEDAAVDPGADLSTLDGWAPRLPDLALIDGPQPPPDLQSVDLSGCPPCSTSCAPCCNDVCAGGNGCASTCSGVACVQCRQQCSNAKSCSATCAGGATCIASADNGDTGTADCSGGSTCTLACTNEGKGCSLSCTGGSHCRLSCKGTSPCTITTCSGGPIPIGSGMMTCLNGDIVCNQLCPLP